MGTSRAYAERIAAERAPKPVRKRKPYGPEEWFDYRVRFLPQQLERARARVAQLEAEAVRIGLTNLVIERP